MARTILAALALATVPALRVAPAKAGAEGEVTVYRTYYGYTGSVTASGVMPYEGEAGCGSAFPVGTILDLNDGHRVICLDHGMLGAYGVDVYCSRGWAECNAENPAGPTGARVERWGGR